MKTLLIILIAVIALTACQTADTKTSGKVLAKIEWLDPVVQELG